jgi:hypothetical protein
MHGAITGGFGIGYFSSNPLAWCISCAMDVFYSYSANPQRSRSASAPTSWALYSSTSEGGPLNPPVELTLGKLVCKFVPQQWFMFNPVLAVSLSRYLALFGADTADVPFVTATDFHATRSSILGLHHDLYTLANGVYAQTPTPANQSSDLAQFLGLINRVCCTVDSRALLARVASLHYSELLPLPRTQYPSVASIINIFRCADSSGL